MSNENIKRKCTIFVADNNDEPVAILYDSYDSFDGSAKNIVYTCERNGSKNLTFILPVPETFKGEEQNYLWNYVVPEYHIVFVLDDVEDIFIISKNSTSHIKNSKNVQVSVNHISSLLKFRALDKEYSQDEGNNIGTAEQLITSILEGTEFTFDELHSARFYEKDGTTEKRRTLNASTKTGAFSLISKACELFDAKPIYDGKNKTVKVLPMNPFSVKAGQELPDFEYASNIYELNYNTNLKSIQRNIDSENICTVLYVVGSWGDKTSGYCSISELEFSRFSYIYTGSEGAFLYFVIPNYFTGIQHNVYFSTADINAGDELEYYALDFASDYYIWNKTQQKAIPTCDVCAATIIVPTEEKLVRNFDFLMDFNYYKEQEFLNGEHIEAIAEYQINAWDILNQIKEASAYESEVRTSVAENIDYGYYASLNIESIENKDGFLYLNLANTDLGEGIVYHSQSETLRRNQWFKWRIANYIDNYGISTNKDASVIYICDKNNNSYIKTFIKEIIYDIDGETKKALKLFWPYDDRLSTPTHYFIFGSDSTMGTFGSCEVMCETAKNTLQDETTYKGVKHPTYYIDTNALAPEVPTSLEWGWLVRYTKNTYTNWTLEFFGGIYGDTAWMPCNYTNKNPKDCTATEQGDYKYWYNYSNGTHWRKTGTSSDAWVLLYDNTSLEKEKVRDSEIAGEFSKVWTTVKSLKKIYTGWYTKYKYTIPSDGEDLQPGNYFFKDEFDDFIIFTTHEVIPKGAVLTYDAIKGYVYPSTATANTCSTQTIKDYIARKYKDNELNKTDFQNVKVTESSKGESSFTYASTGSFSVRSSTPYTITIPSGKSIEIFWYSSSDVLLSHETLSASGDVVSEDGAKICRITMEGRKTDLEEVIFTRKDNTDCKYILRGTEASDAEYSRLGPANHEEDRIGLIECLKNLCVLLDELHINAIPERKRLQKISSDLTTELVNSIGNLYRESWLQNDKYVDGDEQKLFDDGIKDIEELSKPTISYSVGWVDLYNTDKDDKYKWEDIDAETAIYLVDDELGVNQFAYVDKIIKCIDEPSKSNIAINTALTKLSQQSFNDVMSNIVKVSEETKAAESIYKRAEALSNIGQLSADKLDGELFAATVSITGGSSNWTTDSNGNMIFTAADGVSAMMLSGNGLLVSNEKDEYGTWIWKTAINGSGMNASVINTGELNASLINAGTITVDKLTSNAGEKLLIGSSEEVEIFATKDGRVPSGSVDVVKNGGSLISINSTDGITIASGANVDIQSGATVGITGAAVDINGGNVNMAATTKLNLSGAEINMNADSKLTVDSSAVEIKSGTLDLNSSSSATIHGGDTGSSVVLDNSGVKVKGLTVDLQTTTQSGKITFNEGNYIDSHGKLSLCNDKLVLNGADGSINTTGAMNINANGSLNLTSSNSAINMTAGEINIGGDTSKVNITGGTLTATGGKIDIQSTSKLLIASENFNINGDGDVDIDGIIYAREGKIGGDKNSTTAWTIADGRIYSGDSTSSNYIELNSTTDWPIKVGGTGNPEREDEYEETTETHIPVEWINTATYETEGKKDWEATIELSKYPDLQYENEIRLDPDIGGTAVLEVSAGTRLATIKVFNATKDPVAGSTSTYIKYNGEKEGSHVRPDFAVSKDGKVVLSAVYGYLNGQTTELRKFDLRSSLWEVDSAYSTASYNGTFNPIGLEAITSGETGEVTLNLYRQGQAPLSVNFSSAGAVVGKFIQGMTTDVKVGIYASKEATTPIKTVTGYIKPVVIPIKTSTTNGFLIEHTLFSNDTPTITAAYSKLNVSNTFTGTSLSNTLITTKVRNDDGTIDAKLENTLYPYYMSLNENGKLRAFAQITRESGEKVGGTYKDITLTMDETTTGASLIITGTMTDGITTVPVASSEYIPFSKLSKTSNTSFNANGGIKVGDEIKAQAIISHTVTSTTTNTVGTNRITISPTTKISGVDSKTETFTGTNKDITLYHSGSGEDDTLTVSAYMSDGSVRTADDDLVYTADGAIYNINNKLQIHHKITKSGSTVAEKEITHDVVPSVSASGTVSNLVFTPSSKISTLNFTGETSTLTSGYRNGNTSTVNYDIVYDGKTYTKSATLSNTTFTWDKENLQFNSTVSVQDGEVKAVLPITVDALIGFKEATKTIIYEVGTEIPVVSTVEGSNPTKYSLVTRYQKATTAVKKVGTEYTTTAGNIISTTSYTPEDIYEAGTEHVVGSSYVVGDLVPVISVTPIGDSVLYQEKDICGDEPEKITVKEINIEHTVGTDIAIGTEHEPINITPIGSEYTYRVKNLRGDEGEKVSIQEINQPHKTTTTDELGTPVYASPMQPIGTPHELQIKRLANTTSLPSKVSVYETTGSAHRAELTDELGSEGPAPQDVIAVKQAYGIEATNTIGAEGIKETVHRRKDVAYTKGSAIKIGDGRASYGVTPISGSGYSAVNKYLCDNIYTVPSTTYSMVNNSYSSEEITPINEKYSLQTNNIISSARYLYLCDTIKICGSQSYTVFDQEDPESGITYHCVNASKGTVLYTGTSGYGSASKCYRWYSSKQSTEPNYTFYTKGGEVKYTASTAPSTLYSAGTAAQYIKYSGTLYSPTSTKYARLPSSYAGATIGTGVSAEKGWYADVGSDKTVYDAGTEEQYIKYDGTLYENGGSVNTINAPEGTTTIPDTLYEKDTDKTYYDAQYELYRKGGANYTFKVNPPAGTTEVYTAKEPEKYIKSSSILYNKGNAIYKVGVSHETDLYERTGPKEYYPATEQLYKSGGDGYALKDGYTGTKLYEAGEEKEYIETDHILYEKGASIQKMPDITTEQTYYDAKSAKQYYKADKQLYVTGGSAKVLDDTLVNVPLYAADTTEKYIKTDYPMYEKGDSIFTVTGVHDKEKLYEPKDSTYYPNTETLYRSGGKAKALLDSTITGSIYKPGTADRYIKTTSPLYKRGNKIKTVDDTAPAILYERNDADKFIRTTKTLYEKGSTVRYGDYRMPSKVYAEGTDVYEAINAGNYLQENTSGSITKYDGNNIYCAKVASATDKVYTKATTPTEIYPGDKTLYETK